jgi:hypothetical protein
MSPPTGEITGTDHPCRNKEIKIPSGVSTGANEKHLAQEDHLSSATVLKAGRTSEGTLSTPWEMTPLRYLYCGSDLPSSER